MITLCNICKKHVYAPLEILTDSAVSVHVKISLCSFKCLGMYKMVYIGKECGLKERVQEIKTDEKKEVKVENPAS